MLVHAKATFTKLKSGEWGLRIETTNIKAGDSVMVSKANGTTEQKTIGKVIWTGNGVTLATIATSGSRSSYTPRAGKRRNEDDECEACGGNKWTCGHGVGW